MKGHTHKVWALSVAVVLSLSFGVYVFAQEANIDASLKTRSFKSLQQATDDDPEVQAFDRVLREKNEERATPLMEDSRRAVLIEEKEQASRPPSSGINSRSAANDLRSVAESINTINETRKSIAEQLNTKVERGVLDEVGSQIRNDIIADEFIEGVQEEIQRTFDVIQNDIDARVQSVGTGGEPTRTDLKQRVDTALEELEARISNDAESRVHLERSRKIIEKQLSELETSVDDFKRKLEKEDGFSLYRDSDNDGLSDYDEVNIYGTDPLKAFTSGSELTDGERVLQGLNPLDVVNEPIMREDPREEGTVVRDLFKIRDIRVNQIVERTRPVRVQNAEGALVETGEMETVPDAAEIVFSGTALPNSIVTLYIFSTPIVVTVKADANGEWTYTLDHELEDGEHNVFVASVDTTGRILAKSDPIPFVKTAAAVEFVGSDVIGSAVPTRDGFLTNNFLLVASIILVLVIAGVLIVVGMKNDDDDGVTPEMPVINPPVPPQTSDAQPADVVDHGQSS